MAGPDVSVALDPATRIPRRGLATLCRAWQGQGELWQAVAAAAPDETGRTWTSDQVRRRALRVLLPKIARELAPLPEDPREWEDGLPAESQTRLHRAGVARGRVDWRRTAIAGWPPESLVSRQRIRRADTVLLNALAWGVSWAHALLDAAPATLTVPERVATDRLQALASMADHPAVVGLEPRQLAGDDLKALNASGHPWRELERAATAIIHIEDMGLDQLALELLAPDDDMRGKLFHLGVCGEVLFGLQQLGCVVESTRPIGDSRSTSKPAFRTTHAGASWELWFESGGLWSKLSDIQPYKAATQALLGQPNALSADLVLVDRTGRRALILECKDSDDATYVGRGGYHQASTYLVEAHGRLSDETVSLTVGHGGVVSGISTTPLAGGLIGLAEADCLAEVVERFVQGHPLEDP